MPAEEAGRAYGRLRAEQDLAAVGELFASTEMLETLGHLAWLGEHGGQGDAVSFVRAYVDAYRTYVACRR